MKKITIVSLFFILFTSCFKSNSFSVEEFNPVSNLSSSSTEIDLDYTDAIDSGFVIPTIRQLPGGNFVFRFSVQNKSEKPQKYFYKIYYQNESYKFEEAQIDNDGNVVESEYAYENFYGSWEKTGQTFAETPLIPVDGKFHNHSDFFRIVGNPRDEKKYYGLAPPFKYVTEFQIQEAINRIKGSPPWLEKVKGRAAKEKRRLDDQIRMDAKYAIEWDRNHDTLDQKWKRNPRVGYYSFLIVVTTEENLEKIPDYIQDISLCDSTGKFHNPYYYFLKGEGSDMDNIVSVKADSALKVVAHADVSKGIYIDHDDVKSDINLNTSFFNTHCGEDSTMFHSAAFRQYFHKIDQNAKMKNIPVVADVYSYTKQDYVNNQKKYKSEKRIEVPVSVTNCPCTTVLSDKDNKKIIIKNPATKEGDWKKQSTGVITRNGFTYGKFRAKVKLANLLSDDLVWTGITNAVWMINHGNESWNDRRETKKRGYIPKDLNGEQAQREKTLPYSEIDFEILKCNRYWPKASYKNKKIPKEITSDVNKIVVTCTNWDMASNDPSKYNAGVQEIYYGKDTLNVHRWDHWYKALTSKYAAEDVFKSPYYYFEIEWKPTEIIWKIGPEKNKMKVVGYMDSSLTSIPNNQMLMIVTQEFHNAEWWPEAPFSQDFIPFPKRDMIGEIYEIEIE